jgi:hypothetical protein
LRRTRPVTVKAEGNAADEKQGLVRLSSQIWLCATRGAEQYFVTWQV